MTQFLLWLYAFVMLSGFWGLALQNIVPKLMREYLPEEVIFEEIPYIRGQLISQAESIREKIGELSGGPGLNMAAGEGGTATLTTDYAAAVQAVIHFIDQEAVPYLRTQNGRRAVLGGKEASDNQFRLLRLQVPGFIQQPLEQLHDLCDEKRRLDLQTRLHYWLHGWLIVHAPASLLLVVVTLVHAIVAALIYA